MPDLEDGKPDDHLTDVPTDKGIEIIKDKDEGERINLAKAEPKRARQLLGTLQQWVNDSQRS